MAERSRRTVKKSETRSNKKILFVESESALQTLVQYNLEAEGYDVDVSSETSDFLKKSNPKWDLLLLDINLEPIDGFAVIERVRKRNKRSPIIILTDRGEERDRVRGLEAGANDYIIKPFSVPELLARIKAAFRSMEQFESGDAYTSFSNLERIYLISHRLDVVANTLAELRINSIADEIEELRILSDRLRLFANDDPVERSAKKELERGVRTSLPVLDSILERLGTERGGEMLIAGAVAGLVGLGGWPAVTAYSLSMAAWMGKDAFTKALETALRKRK